MAARDNSFREFLLFWSSRPEVRKIWFSLFTPQVGDVFDEILSPQERASTLEQLIELRAVFP